MKLCAVSLWRLSMILFSALAVCPGPARADSALTGVMKKMGADLRQVMDQVGQAELNASSAAACADLQEQIARAANLVPDSVGGLPAGRQAAALQQYRAALSELNGLVEKLRRDFQAGDNAAAAADLKKVVEQRNNGHQAFDPDEDGVDLEFPAAGLVAHCVWVIGPSLTDEAVLRISWRSKSSGAPLTAPLSFAVSLAMPSMPEMINPPVAISPVKRDDGSPLPGSFLVSGIYFSMAGAWTVTVKLGQEIAHFDPSVNANP